MKWTSLGKFLLPTCNQIIIPCVCMEKERECCEDGLP